MDRIVRKVGPIPSTAQQDEELWPFSTYDNAANIILLGDPGAGKTHTFREAAARCGGQFVPARAFLVKPATQFDGSLFIDGLDEKRAGRSDRDTVDALVEKLFAVASQRVRISCRVADWLGESDLAALRPYFEQSGEPVVLQLGRLSDDEQREVLQLEGLSADEVEAFLGEATERALDDFLDNPQNLIMLSRAVRAGTWPATRRELFELSTKLMLKEFDTSHARSGSGTYAAEELRSAVGAACAARLISDIEAISLTDHEDSPIVPSYRGLSMIAPEKMIAALGRRIFVAGPKPESVDYAHRTTAEYLGAAWLADTVRAGLPFGRLSALMGVDGHPASELRGLHAWLAVHLPEHASRLIDADPYGVLAYGDAASLTQSSCAQLIKALGSLSQTDPWFRSGDWQHSAIAALSRVDMLEEFRAVLRSSDSGLGVRSIVIEAMAFGPPIVALKDDLAEVVLRSQSPLAERLYALVALLRIGPDGTSAAEAAFHRLGADINGLRLRAEMIHRMYGEPFGPIDVAALLKDLAASLSRETATNILHRLPERMPLGDIPAVLDNIPQPAFPTQPDRRNERVVAQFLDRLLARVWRGDADIEPARALQWLRLRGAYSRGHGSGPSDHLRLAILGRKDRLGAITKHFFARLEVDGDQWHQLLRFRESILWGLTSAELLSHINAHMTCALTGSKKESFLYEAAFSVLWSMDSPESEEAFESLFHLGNRRTDLRSVREASMSCEVPSGYFGRTPCDRGEQSPEDQRAAFEKESEAIRAGRHLGWLTWAARVYLGLFSDSDDQASPRERLISALGEKNADMAVAGLIATLSRHDLPSFADVVALSAQHQRYDWWYALAVGLVEGWESNGTPSLSALSDDFLKAMLVFELVNPVFENTDGIARIFVPDWKAALLKDRPDLVRDAYITIARAKLARGDQTVDGLRELMVEDVFKPYRGEIAVELLRDFPNADPFRLEELVSGVFDTPAAHGEFLIIADAVLTGAVPTGQRQLDQYDRWLAAAYLLSPNRYEARLQEVAEQRPSIVFVLRDHGGFGLHGSQSSALPLRQLEFLARLTGTHYPDAGWPGGGWQGNTNPWDAADFGRKLISAISAIPSVAASEVLRRLESDPAMASYGPRLRHALANQERRRRELEYDRPDWSSTIKALSNGAPATVADLHALLLHQLNDVRERIAHENTNLHRLFWNVAGYSRPDTPRPENDCRNALITLLRPALAPKGITVEPEGHMVNDKRADISVAMPSRKVLCELKRDYHPDLWTAADQQLERFYAHDPEAKGFGIYGVFWFGEKRPSPVPKHPGGLGPPKLANELEQMLRDRIPPDRRNRLAVIVIDVSGARV